MVSISDNIRYTCTSKADSISNRKQRYSHLAVIMEQSGSINVTDLQMVNIGLRVLHRPDKDHLPTVYCNLGKDYDDRVLPSIMNEVYNASVDGRWCLVVYHGRC